MVAKTRSNRTFQRGTERRQLVRRARAADDERSAGGADANAELANNSHSVTSLPGGVSTAAAQPEADRGRGQSTLLDVLNKAIAQPYGPHEYMEGVNHRLRAIARGRPDVSGLLVDRRPGSGAEVPGDRRVPGGRGGPQGRTLHSLSYRARAVAAKVANPEQGLRFLSRESEKGKDWYEAVATELMKRFPVMKRHSAMPILTPSDVQSAVTEAVSDQSSVKSAADVMRNRYAAWAIELAAIGKYHTGELQHVVVCLFPKIGHRLSALVTDDLTMDDLLAGARLDPWYIPTDPQTLSKWICNDDPLPLRSLVPESDAEDAFTEGVDVAESAVLVTRPTVAFPWWVVPCEHCLTFPVDEAFILPAEDQAVEGNDDDAEEEGAPEAGATTEESKLVTGAAGVTALTALLSRVTQDREKHDAQAAGTTLP